MCNNSNSSEIQNLFLLLFPLILQLLKEKMKEFEGWEESDLLPEGWIYRVNWEGFVKSKNTFGINILYLSKEGKVFESMRAATEYMARIGFKKADILRCKEFLQERNQMSMISRKSWVESETVPTGWKIQSSGTKVLSPSGRQFRSVLQAVTTLSSERVEGVNLEEMREKLVEHEGWKRSSLLPSNWIFKVKLKASDTEEKQLLQLSSRYKLLRGKKSVLMHMEASGKYTKEHIDSYHKFWQQFGAESLETKYTWKTSSTLPEGWRLRKTGDREFLLSPRDEQFRTRFVALKSLLKMEPKPGKEAEEMREKMMEHEGWKQEGHLPKGWLAKEFPTFIKKGRKKKVYQRVLYLSSDGECFQGIIPALAHMRESGRYTKMEVDRMEAGGGGGGEGGGGSEAVEAKQEQEQTSDDQFAPHEITPMSDPDSQGQSEPSSSCANGKKQKPAMSGNPKTIPKHGWTKSPKLPEGWKFRSLPRKVGRKRQIWFLSPQVSHTSHFPMI